MMRWPPLQPAAAPVGRSGVLGAGSERNGATSSVTGLGTGAGFIATRVGAGAGAGFVASRAGAAAGAGAGAGAGARAGWTRRSAGALAGGALGVSAASSLCQSDGSDLVDAAAAPG